MLNWFVICTSESCCTAFELLNERETKTRKKKLYSNGVNYWPPSSAQVKECVELYLHCPNTPSLRGARLKKHNFTFTLTMGLTYIWNALVMNSHFTKFLMIIHCRYKYISTFFTPGSYLPPNSTEQSPFEKFISLISLRDFSPFMESEGSLPCSQQPTTSIYPWSFYSIPHPYNLCKINFNIILPSTPMFLKLFLSIRFFD
jgi:hypothetical protein